MMRSNYLLTIVLLLSFASGCQKKQAEAEPAEVSANSPVPNSAEIAASDANVAAVDASLTTAEKTGQLTSSTTTYLDATRKFIRTATASFQVKDVYQSTIAIEDAVAAQGGFVTKNSVHSDIQDTKKYLVGNGKQIELVSYVVRGDLTVRVPSDRTQDLLRALITQIEFLDQRNFEARDAQLDLLRQQLEFQRNQETQQALGQATGGRLKDKTAAISAQNDAKGARDEAQLLKKEFEDSVAFSTINLSIYQLAKVRQHETIDVNAVFQDQRPSFWSRLAHSLNVGWQALLDVFVLLMSIWPLMFFITAGVFGYVHFKRKS